MLTKTAKRTLIAVAIVISFGSNFLAAQEDASHRVGKIHAIFLLADSDFDIGQTVRFDTNVVSILFARQIPRERAVAPKYLLQSRDQLNLSTIVQTIQEANLEKEDAIVCFYAGRGQFTESGKLQLLLPDGNRIDKSVLLSMLESKECSITFLISDFISPGATSPPSEETLGIDLTSNKSQLLGDLLLNHEGVIDVCSASPGELSSYVQNSADGGTESRGSIFVREFAKECSLGESTWESAPNWDTFLDRWSKGVLYSSHIADKTSREENPERLTAGKKAKHQNPKILLKDIRRTYSLTKKAMANSTDRVPSSGDQTNARLLSDLGTLTNSVGMRLIKIPSGRFMMGSSRDTQSIKRLLNERSTLSNTDEYPQHRVRIKESFLLGSTEVTQGQWYSVMKSQPWKGKRDVVEGKDYPAVYINWDDANAFCRHLSEIESRTYRLPTEAEWEYACRAGTSTMFSFGDDVTKLSRHAWWQLSTSNLDSSLGPVVYQEYAHQVGLKSKNPWGLFDMHGNAKEWCADYYGDYGSATVSDPRGPSSGKYRVRRGGSWSDMSFECRSAARTLSNPLTRNYDFGFRVVREVEK